MDENTLTGILEFINKAENLKNTLRYAYTTNGKRESAAEHSWRLCLLVLVLGPYFETDNESLDREKLLRLAVIHDLGEAVSGDVPAICEQASANKSGLEREGLLELCASLPERDRDLLLALWDEYSLGSTREAQLVKGLDKIETIMQHNQGLNPPEIDYRFNLGYGQEHMDYHTLLRQIRDELDNTTRSRAGVELDC